MNDDSSSMRRDRRSLLAIGAVGGCLTFITVLAAPFLLVPASKRLGSLPWMATPVHRIHEALERIEYFESQARFHIAAASQSHIPRKQRLIDLGSGDGRVCITAAEHYNYEAYGVELNPVLIALSYFKSWRMLFAQWRCRRSEADHHANIVPPQFLMRDFWGLSLLDYDVITVFGVKSIMQRLLDKIAEERRCISSADVTDGNIEIEQKICKRKSDEELKLAITGAVKRPLYIVCYRFPLPPVTDAWVKQLYAKNELFIYLYS